MASAGTQNINNTNHEDYTDILSIVEPTKTPLFSSIRKGPKPTNVKHEWTVDSLDSVRVRSVPEGHDVAEYDNSGQNRQRLSSFVTIMEESWRITDLQMLSNPAGVTDMSADGKAKKLSEWKRNAAARFCGDYEQSDGTGGTNYESRGLGNWISSSAQSQNPVPAAYRTPAASIDTTATTSLSEANVNAVIASVYQAGGDPVNANLYANVNLKIAISKFSRNTTENLNYIVTEDASRNKITMNVTAFEGDFGIIKVIPDLFIGYANGGTDAVKLARGYVVNPELLQLNWMTPLSHTNGLDGGGGPRGTWKGVLTMSCLNPRGFGKFAATS